MAEFKSRYVELGFYVSGHFRQFRNGRYVTEDKAEIEVLSGLIDADRVDYPAKNEKKAEDAATAPKATAKKASAK